MDYYFNFCIFIILCSCYTCPSQTIATKHKQGHQDYYRSKALLPPDKANWEMGLREATYQALAREQVPDPSLRTGIYAANIEGLQTSTGTPFGDIAIVARGQLFATAQGYHFVQDHNDDCEHCDKHSINPRCSRRPCLGWQDRHLHNLMALWTVKRIRHRDPKLGHRYELQFTISPMGPAAEPHFVARNGRFDYNVPGHVFIVKLNESTDKEHRSSNHNEFKVLPWSHNIDQLYQQHHHHHHPPQQPQTPNSIVFNTDVEHRRRPATTEHQQQHVYNPGFLIGISPNGYKHILHDLPGFVGERPPYLLPPPRHYIPPPPAPLSTSKEPIKHLHHHFYIPEVADIDYDAAKKTPLYTGGTTQHQVSPTPPITNPYTDFQTTITQQHQPPTVYKFYTAPPAPFSPSPFYIQYSEPDPMYSHSTAPNFITTHSLQPTVPTFVTLSDLEEHSKTAATLVGLFDEIAYTAQTSTASSPPVHKHRKQKYPDSINAQLPPPDKNTDTTVPYVASTAVTFVSTPSTVVTSSSRFEYTAAEDSLEKGEKSEQRKETTIQEQQVTLAEKFTSRKKTTSMIELIPTTTTTSAPTITTIETTTISSSSSTEQDFHTIMTTGETEIFSAIPISGKKKKNKTKDEQLDVELFGTTKRTTAGTNVTAQPGTTAKNAFDEIFSDYKVSTEQNKRFLTPHTQLSINNTDALRNARISKYLKYKKNKAPHRDRFSLKAEKEKRQKEEDENEGAREAKTSQSFITSISFKVNKNKNQTRDETGFHIHEVQKPNTSTDRAQTFDDVAHTLVNHARIEAYLNAKRRRAAHHK